MSNYLYFALEKLSFLPNVTLSVTSPWCFFCLEHQALFWRIILSSLKLTNLYGRLIHYLQATYDRKPWNVLGFLIIRCWLNFVLLFSLFPFHYWPFWNASLIAPLPPGLQRETARYENPLISPHQSLLLESILHSWELFPANYLILFPHMEERQKLDWHKFVLLGSESQGGRHWGENPESLPPKVLQRNSKSLGRQREMIYALNIP